MRFAKRFAHLGINTNNAKIVDVVSLGIVFVSGSTVLFFGIEATPLTQQTGRDSMVVVCVVLMSELTTLLSPPLSASES